MRRNREKKLEEIKSQVKTLILYCNDKEREQVLKELQILLDKLKRIWSREG